VLTKSDRPIFFTSATRTYLPKVKVLAESLRAHNPQARFVLALLDDDENLPESIISNSAIDAVFTTREILNGKSKSWLFQHTVVEACTAVKAGVLARLLRESGSATVTYLDPDIQVFGSFDELLSLHRASSIVLTPHITSPESSVKGILDNEVSALRHGVFNLGFVSVSADEVGKAFADWWDVRLSELCVDDLAGGIFTDQKWIDLVPGLFERVMVTRDPGFNVSTWNLADRPVVRNLDGALQVKDQPLVFAHFSGYDSGDHSVAIEPFAESHATFVKLSHEYSDLLRAADIAVGPQPRWVFGHFTDGSRITDGIRRRYRFDAALRERFPDPFETFGAELQPGDVEPDWATVRSHSNLEQIQLERFHSFLTDDVVGAMRVSDTYVLSPRGGMNGLESPDAGAPAAKELALWAPQDAERIREILSNGLPTVAYFSVASGGCAFHVDDLAALMLPSMNVVQFTFHSHDHGTAPHLRVGAVGASGIAHATIPMASAAEMVPEILSRCMVDFVHVHHRFGVESALDVIRSDFKGRYGVTIHDYSWISPEPHLAGRTGGFIGAPSAQNWQELCEAASQYTDEGVQVPSSPTAYAEFLLGASFVIAPSEDCASRYRSVIPSLDIQVHAHWEAVGVPQGTHLSQESDFEEQPRSDPIVVIPGEFMPTKGANVVEAVARLALKSDLNCQFVSLGVELQERDFSKNIEFHGRYTRGTLGDEIRYAGGTVGWLPSQVPETFSYAASELMRSGLPIVVSDLGALPDRVEMYPSRLVVQHDAHPREWLAALYNAHHLPNALTVADSVTSGRSNFYPEGYLALIRR
jgi:glycosyltransferase involved in cell wall biosynthesis